MNNRIQQFLKAENISQSQFADTIGVARASVSHILAGRNKPGYDFIESMARHYPAVSLDWLISGKGKMYRRDSEPNPVVEPPVDVREPAEMPKIEPASSIQPIEKPSKPIEGQKVISKIVVFYSDNTYQELK